MTWNGFLADYLEIEAFNAHHALLAVSQQHKLADSEIDQDLGAYP
ncbi:hypothetical protein [Bradyrhizobium sp. 143]|nr:hypothetical protein [Bradyrhizobium sp. 143]